jgi:O-glycosyl hydrolase
MLLRRSGLALIAAAALIGAAFTTTSDATPSDAATAPVTAEIAEQAQTIAGFGASGAWWVNDLAHYSSAAQTQVANLLFTPSGIDLSQYRYNIGGGGVGVSAGPRALQSLIGTNGTYNWSNDPGGQTFLELAAQDGVPDLIGFVNSAPSQWTTNHANCGSSLISGDEGAYGTFLATVVAHFASQGITIDQISPMNEPDNNFFTCGQEGMSVGTGQRGTIVQAVGSALAAAKLPTTVIADESSQTTQFTSEVPQWLPGSPAAPYVSALAHHTYDFPGNGQLEDTGAVGALNDKPTWASEICCQVTGGGYGQQYDPTIAGGLVLANYLYQDLAYTGDSAFQWWTALSPELGCDPTANASCPTSVNGSGWNDGLLYYDPNYASNGNQNIYATKRFYVLGQYSRYVRPGAVRYAITGGPPGVQAMAFWQNNAWTVVATNTNTATTSFSLNTDSGTLTPQTAVRTTATQNLATVAAPSVSGSTMTASLPAQSVTTYVLGSSGQPGSTARPASELVGNQSNRCLDVTGASTANNAPLELFDCNAGANQEFSLTTSGPITVYSGSNQKCLDAYQQKTAPGTPVNTFTCNGGRNQQWTVHPDGAITNNESGLCLDAYNQDTGNGTKVELWSCNGGTNQQWPPN